MKTLDQEVTTLPSPTRLRLALYRLTRAMRKEGSHHLTASELSALTTLEDQGPVRISRLAQLESIDPSVATRLVANLEADGLFLRRTDPDDGRASVIDLSTKGRRILREVWEERTRTLALRLERLSAKDLQAINAAIPALEKLSRDA